MGLDVKTFTLFVNIIKNLKSTVILTSHDLSVVEKLCDRIAFINKGKILNAGTQEEVKELVESGIKIEIYIKHQKQELISELHRNDFIIDITEHRKEGFLVRLKEWSDYQELFKLLSNFQVMKIKEVETSLEDIFLKQNSGK